MPRGLINPALLTDIADAIRAKNGSSNTYTPAEMAAAIAELSASDPFTFGEIPDYVKAEAYSVAQKVRAVQTANTVTSIVYADAHHTASQDSSSWQTQTNISTLHAAMGMALVAAMCKIDFAAYCGDYTFGNGDTTYPLFVEQVEEMNKYMGFAFGGIPALYCVGNHDTGEYYLRDNPDGALYGAENVYRLIGGKNADGTTVMGSTTYGYCYRDISSKKVRVICLNTVEGETEEGYNGGQCSDAQLLWFAQTLYSIGANADWGIIVVSHYPLDYGGTFKAGNIVYEYVNGGSVTYNGSTVNFSGHNAAKFVAQFHGHTHCLKVAKLNRIQNNAGTEFNAWRIATPSGTYFRNNDYAGHPVYGIDFGEDVAYTKTANSGADTAFVVNVYDPDKELVTSICYGAGYDRSVGIGGTVYHQITQNLTRTLTTNSTQSVEDGDAFQTTITPESGYDLQPITVTMGGVDVTAQVVTMNAEVQSYTVKNHLTNATNNNANTTVSGSYAAVLTPDSGYELSAVTITMGGVDITATVYSSGTISIPNVTGDVVITATATKMASYTNQVPISTDASGAILDGVGYVSNTRISSGGSTANANGFATTGFMPCTVGQTIRLGGDGITFAEYGCMLFFYKSDKTPIEGADYAKVGNATWGTWATESNTAFTLTSSKPSAAAYIRISAKGSGANMIVTINEPIDD